MENEVHIFDDIIDLKLLYKQDTTGKHLYNLYYRKNYKILYYSIRT